MSEDRIRADLEAVLGVRVSEVAPIPEGHSGFTYFVTTDEGRYVLRLPPPGARIAGTADVMRQGRIMAALHDAGLPAPKVPFIRQDPVVDGRPFILMERVDGTRIESTAQKERPLDIARSAIEVLKRLQSLPIDRTGIGDEEPVGIRPEMMRWAMLMQRAPEERAPTLVHGDYHFGNMLFRGANVIAVLDWEIAELGQPLLDLGCLCAMTVRRGLAADAPNPGGAVALELDELLRLYGVDEAEMRWYVALSLYKYAAILGYNLMLHRKGRRPDPMYEGLTDTISGMIDEGISLL